MLAHLPKASVTGQWRGGRRWCAKDRGGYSPAASLLTHLHTTQGHHVEVRRSEPGRRGPRLQMGRRASRSDGCTNSSVYPSRCYNHLIAIVPARASRSTFVCRVNAFASFVSERGQHQLLAILITPPSSSCHQSNSGHAERTASVMGCTSGAPARNRPGDGGPARLTFSRSAIGRGS